jgi:hypothetical protein
MPSMDTVKFVRAAAAYLDLKIVTADVKEDAHPQLNKMDDTACKNSRKIGM